MKTFRHPWRHWRLSSMIRKALFLAGLLALLAVALPASADLRGSAAGVSDTAAMLGGTRAQDAHGRRLAQIVRGASVRLLVKGPGGRVSFACSATLTAEDRLVTAAHCFDEQRLSGEAARRYLAEITDPATSRKTTIELKSMTAACPLQAPVHGNTCDVAAAVLSSPAKGARPLPVCDQKTRFDQGRTVVAGSGTSEEDESSQNSPLKYMELPYREALGNPRTLSARAEAGTQRPCSGDSGGGIIFDDGVHACLRGVHHASTINDRKGLSAADGCRLAKEHVVYGVNLAGRAALIEGLAGGRTPTAADVGLPLLGAPPTGTNAVNHGAR